jgi:hypothetical protein
MTSNRLAAVSGRARTVLVALTALLAACALAACGHKEDVVTSADTEGPYVDAGPLQYQVQLSRQLNPADEEDKAYFVGVKDPEGELKPEETWFGVFVKVFNRTGDSHLPSKDFEIEDTVGKTYEPVGVGENNVFAYRATEIPSGAQLPGEDDVANQGVIGGSMLLFKLTLTSLANRPLILHIKSSGTPPEAEVHLDV